MAFFESPAHLKKILGGFFQILAENPAIQKSLLDSRLVIRFCYTEPEASLTIDARNPPIVITMDDTEKNPEVEMSMKAETAHLFWMGKVNLMMALTRGEIRARGSIPKILKLLPVIKPAYALYPGYLKSQGLTF